MFGYDILCLHFWAINLQKCPRLRFEDEETF